ncbi:hypothetical protein [Chryseobacterium gleum]|uniref:hypothetical protein n=1 Tax=Chryseobacterium gleum TaxID=250 RepID=UPI0031DD1FAD
MRKIPKPTLAAKDVFLECVSTVSNSGLKQSYENCQDLIEAAAQDFDNRFPRLEIYQIPRNLTVLGSIGKKEMKSVYTYRMVTDGMPGNTFYRILKNAAPYGKCPLCSVRLVETLDHYLPKSLYPILSVVPVNLIPACSSCNTGKKISYPTNSVEQTFHPYYDDVQDERWIRATLLPFDPFGFHYFVECPDSWEQIKKDRANNHFNSFKLNELFTAHANEEFRGAKSQMKKLFNQHPSQLIEHLDDAFKSRRDELGINSWQAIMYHSLLTDTWFIQGGVLNF